MHEIEKGSLASSSSAITGGIFVQDSKDRQDVMDERSHNRVLSKRSQKQAYLHSELYGERADMEGQGLRTVFSSAEGRAVSPRNIDALPDNANFTGDEKQSSTTPDEDSVVPYDQETDYDIESESPTTVLFGCTEHGKTTTESPTFSRRRRLNESDCGTARSLHKRHKSEPSVSPICGPLPPFLFEMGNSYFGIDEPPLPDFGASLTGYEDGVLPIAEHSEGLDVVAKGSPGSGAFASSTNAEDIGHQLACEDLDAMVNVYGTDNMNYPSLTPSINPVAPPDYGF